MPVLRVKAAARLLPHGIQNLHCLLQLGESAAGGPVLMKDSHLRTGQQLRDDGLLQGAFQGTGHLCSTAVGAGGSPWGGPGESCRADLDIDCRAVMLHVAPIANFMRTVHCCHHLSPFTDARLDRVIYSATGCVCIQSQVATVQKPATLAFVWPISRTADPFALVSVPSSHLRRRSSVSRRPSSRSPSGLTNSMKQAALFLQVQYALSALLFMYLTP